MWRIMNLIHLIGCPRKGGHSWAYSRRAQRIVCKSCPASKPISEG